METHSFFNRFCHLPVLRLAAVTLVALAWGSLAFGGEIHDAAKGGDVEKIKALLKANPELVSMKDRSGKTPLHSAAAKGHKNVADLLLAKGADVNAKDNAGLTPLHCAAANEHKNVAELLLAKGADVNAKSKNGNTPLKEAVAECVKLPNLSGWDSCRNGRPVKPLKCF